MNELDRLESKAIYILREAYSKYGEDGLGMCWSMGKDSTTLVWLALKAFLGKLPFKVIHIDTTYKFPEMYAYREKYAKEWGLDLVITKNEAALAGGMNKNVGRFTCCNALKTEPFKAVVKEQDLKAICLAIRRDEHGVRAKERYFSPRDENFKWDYQNQPVEMWDQYVSSDEESQHLRVHPLLDWTELDVWRYIARENIPVIPMYYAKNGKRYRSIGCAPCTDPVPSDAATTEAIIAELQTTQISERQGRAQDKERQDTMQKLRALGYM